MSIHGHQVGQMMLCKHCLEHWRVVGDKSSVEPKLNVLHDQYDCAIAEPKLCITFWLQVPGPGVRLKLTRRVDADHSISLFRLSFWRLL